MIVISDSTPLINFAKLGRLDLLRKLFGKVCIPEAVYYEVVIEGAGKPGAVEVKTATWIERCSVAQEFIDELTGFVLDLGERESIALALQMGADLLILDEITGRKAARQLKLHITGTIGLLERAFRRGLISDLREVLDELCASGFWVSERLYQAVLEDNDLI
jgi:hypothetical protein